MDHRPICSWLGISPDQWPPDHYTLLSLESGEADRERIEQHAHERLACLRRYQLANPELATEAMNRLAQAVVCLTDPAAKTAYDAELAGEQLVIEAPPIRREAEQPAPVATDTATADPLAWLFGPWNPLNAEPALSPPVTAIDWTTAPPPARIPAVPVVPPGPAETIVGANGTTVEAPSAAAENISAAAATPAVPPADPVVEAARSSSAARRGLLTKRGLYNRIARTRQLLRAWEEAGKYLRDPARRLAKRVEATDLVHQLSTIRQVLRSFPPLLGEAGQPGYSVIALARQQMIVQTFQALLPSQREVLARDWGSGHTLLTAHRQFLRDELRTLRRKSYFGRTARAVRAFLGDHPGLWLLVMGLAALNLAALPWLQRLEGGRLQVLFLLTQLVFLVAVLGVGIARWRKEFRKSWLDRSVQARPKPVSPRPSGAKPAASTPQVRSAR